MMTMMSIIEMKILYCESMDQSLVIGALEYLPGPICPIPVSVELSQEGELVNLFFMAWILSRTLSHSYGCPENPRAMRQ